MVVTVVCVSDMHSSYGSFESSKCLFTSVSLEKNSFGFQYLYMPSKGKAFDNLGFLRSSTEDLFESRYFWFSSVLLSLSSAYNLILKLFTIKEI